MDQPTNTSATKNPAAQAIGLYVGGYLAISLGALVALALLHNHHNQATQEAWVHGIIVAATALLMATFARGTARGNSRMYLRLRITSSIMIVAIAVTSAIPGDFPMWMKLEQVVCGLLLIALTFALNSRSTKTFFSTK
ncbi:MAG TPA: hypothetical protein VLG92_04655 [Candidatus Saccharimonadia bacterium]|nr:hypothetical protein [Candidatus Saccharimonadia bacterium]